MAKETTAKNKNVYSATEDYKKVMSNQGLLTDVQHKKLLKGDAVNLANVPTKQMRYLVTNGLIKN
tara:strand:+ start:370 stop:564 length:195 start_codon:yes stop_codon:yes gene_type:complete